MILVEGRWPTDRKSLKSLGPRKKIGTKSAVVLRLYSLTNFTFSLEFNFSEDIII